MSNMCWVCEKVPHKYKCAGCRNIRYCSLACGNAHKETCEHIVVVPGPSPVVHAPELRIEDTVYPEESEGGRWEVTKEQFSKLARDEKIRGSLTFAQLQETIREIDGSPNRLAALRKTLTVDQDFAMFVNAVMESMGGPAGSSMT